MRRPSGEKWGSRLQAGPVVAFGVVVSFRAFPPFAEIDQTSGWPIAGSIYANTIVVPSGDS